MNHISPGSHQFQDFLEHGDKSQYAEMFVKWRDIWPEGECEYTIDVGPLPGALKHVAASPQLLAGHAHLQTCMLAHAQHAMAMLNFI